MVFGKSKTCRAPGGQRRYKNFCIALVSKLPEPICEIRGEYVIFSANVIARVAQWIRAFASGAKGRRFDPCRGYQRLAQSSNRCHGSSTSDELCPAAGHDPARGGLRRHAPDDEAVADEKRLSRRRGREWRRGHRHRRGTAS